MELRQLRYFVAVARQRHFTRAAEELHVAQPALSQQIQQLERELGVLLFDRGGRRVQLTAPGEAFLARAERILAEVDQARAELQEYVGLVRGRIRLGALPSLAEALPGLLARFHARYPGLEIGLREESTEQLIELLERGQVDLALRHQTLSALPAGSASEPLFREELVLVVAPSHAFAQRQRVALAELREQPFILLKPGSIIRQTVLQACAVEGFAPRVAFESGAIATVRALAAEGLGMAIIPRSLAATDGPPVAMVALGPPALTRTVALARLANRQHSAAASAFLAFARSYPWADTSAQS